MLFIMLRSTQYRAVTVLYVKLLNLCRGDFDVADVTTQNISFFAMMSSASQKLLGFVKKGVYPEEHFGLKMLYSKQFHLYALDLVCLDVYIVYMWHCTVIIHCTLFNSSLRLF